MTNRSLCYASMKNWPKSLRDADKAIALKGDWEKGWYRRGVALSNMERYEDAMAAFQKCLDLNPSSKDYQTQYDQAKRDLYKGLSESEILKMEGNEVRTQHDEAEKETLENQMRLTRSADGRILSHHPINLSFFSSVSCSSLSVLQARQDPGGH